MSKVLVTRSVGCRLMPPVFGNLTSLSDACSEKRAGVVPSGTIQANSPVLRLSAVIRLYGGFRMGSPLTRRLALGPRENRRSDFGSLATVMTPGPVFEGM